MRRASAASVPGGLAHDEAAARDARRRLAVVRHRGAAAGDEQVLRNAIADVAAAACASGSWLKPRDSGIFGQRHSTSPATCSSSGQPLTPIVSAKLGAADHLVAAQHVLAEQAPRLADAELRCDLEQVRVLEAGHARAQEAQVVDRLAPTFDLAVARATRASVPSTALPSAFFSCVTLTRHSPRVALRPHDRAAAREAELAGRLGFVHARGNRPPRFAGARVVDAADAKHQRRKEQRAARRCIARAGEVGEVAVARAVDEGRGADRPSRPTSSRRASASMRRARPARRRPQGVEQDLGAGAEQHRVGGALEGRGVVRLREDLAEDEVRLAQAVERAQRSSSSSATPCTTWMFAPCTLASRPQKLVTPAAVPMPPRKP